MATLSDKVEKSPALHAYGVKYCVRVQELPYILKIKLKIHWQPSQRVVEVTCLQLNSDQLQDNLPMPSQYAQHCLLPSKIKESISKKK